jgi:3-(3-hydroxy-phenyl)propionate hydroxylase
VDLAAFAALDGPIDFGAVTFDATPRPAHPDGCADRHAVAVVGAGPVGLCLAIDLAQRGVDVVLLDNDARLSAGSRAICFAQRTLQVFDRLGCGDPVAARGVKWSVGRVFFRDEPVYRFDLLPEAGHERSAFVNLAQHDVEGHLVRRAGALGLDLRWRHEVVACASRGDGVVLAVRTPDGDYDLVADHVVACDGSRSAVRRLIGQERHGRVFRDRFLIADVRMARAQPAERWFWFEPPFHPGGSVLLHMQPDGVWRVDFQLGWDADPEEEKQPERILPRVRALLGPDVPFELVWASVYTFACERMDAFRHGRVLFAGDAAHGVSPFGARGANSGIQDAENLAWKLAAVVRGEAPDALLDTYASEREAASDENIRHSTRATDFITPKSEVSRLFRDAVLELARTCAFARTLVNSGRLSTASTLHDSPLNTPDEDAGDDAFAPDRGPGAPAVDAPVADVDGAPGWLLRRLARGFTLLWYGEEAPPAAGVDGVDIVDASSRHEPIELVTSCHVLWVRPQATPGSVSAMSTSDACPVAAIDTVLDVDGLVAARYHLREGSAVLFRPDHHVCARWRQLRAETLRAALRRATARETA